MSKAKRHAHKYHKVQTPFGKIWACALSDCSHHMPHHYEGLLPGKYSVCWGCGELLILDAVSMKEDKPRCIECRSGLSGIVEVLSNEYLSD